MAAHHLEASMVKHPGVLVGGTFNLIFAYFREGGVGGTWVHTY